MTVDGYDLTGRVALVTGGSRGLGREMVLGLAQAGCDVVIASRTLDACEAVAAEVRERFGVRALPYACHVGRWDELDGLVDAAYAEFGRVDILVNNAGKSPLYDTVADVNEKMWDSVLDLNLKGPFRLCSLIGPRMQDAGRGSIVNISSIGAIRPTKDIVPYAAAKAGLNAMTEGLADAFGPEVRVNCVMPGTFLTDISDAWDMDVFEARAQSFALRRGGRPEEITGIVLYLAGDAAGYTTGAVIPVHGGHP